MDTRDGRDVPLVERVARMDDIRGRDDGRLAQGSPGMVQQGELRQAAARQEIRKQASLRGHDLDTKYRSRRSKNAWP